MDAIAIWHDYDETKTASRSSISTLIYLSNTVGTTHGYNAQYWSALIPLFPSRCGALRPATCADCTYAVTP